MDTYKTEEEQVEALKKWLRENGSSIVTGILLALAVVFALKAWLAYRDRQAQAASNLFTQVVGSVQTGAPDKAQAAYDALIKDHGGSHYAFFGSLAMAHYWVDQGKKDTARALLQWALDHADGPDEQALAHLRMARLLLDEGKLDQAADLLQAQVASPYGPLFAELEGDLARAKGDPEAARKAYDRVLAAAGGDASALRQFVQAKRDDLGIPDTAPGKAQ